MRDEIINELCNAIVNLPLLSAASSDYAEAKLIAAGHSITQLDCDHADYNEHVESLYYSAVAEFQMNAVGRAIGALSNCMGG